MASTQQHSSVKPQYRPEALARKFNGRTRESLCRELARMHASAEQTNTLLGTIRAILEDAGYYPERDGLLATIRSAVSP